MMVYIELVKWGKTMGFFKKIFKGIGKVFKKIGKGIKKAFKKFGKFMGKLGVVGQLAMMFILPGIGGALLKGFGSLAGKMAGLTGRFAGLSGSALGTVVKGAGTVLKGAHSFVQTGVNAFKTVTNGIMEFGKTALNKLPGINIQSATPDFFGEEGVLNKISTDAKRIFDPFKSSITATKDMTLKSLSNTTGLSQGQIQKLNPSMDFTKLQQGTNINLDFNKVAVTNTDIVTQLNNTSASALDVSNRSIENIDLTSPDITPDQIKNLNYNVGAEGLNEGFFDPLKPVQTPVDVSQALSAKIPEIKPVNVGLGSESILSNVTTTPDSSSLLGTAQESLTTGADLSAVTTSPDSLTASVDNTGFFRGKVLGLEPGETFGQGFKRQTGEAIGSQIRSVATQSILGGGQEAPPEEFVGSYGQPVDAGTVQITAATPMADVYNQAYNVPMFGGGAFINQSLDILNQNFGVGGYQRFAPRARGMA